MSQVCISNRKSFLQRYHEIMPTGAGALFLIQIFSTLSYSVLYSTLILYITNGLHMNDTQATSITGSFIALNYFLHLLGGYAGGRYFSYRSLFSLSMVLQIFGCALISIPDTSILLWGLAIFLGGCGLNVTCINCMVTQLFEPDDKRRETAFLWNYSGMNIGFFVGFSLGGYFHLHHAYHQLFLLSGLGNLTALLLTFYHWHKLRDRDTTFITQAKTVQRQYQWIGLGIITALLLTLRVMLEHTTLCNQLILVIGAGMFALVISLTLKQPELFTRQKMWAYLILAVASLTFWTLYQLAPMGLSLFTERNVDRHVFGMMIAPQWVQNINTIIIIAGGPLLGMFFSSLRERGLTISIPFQFSLALLLIGAGFAILPIGIQFANADGYVNFNWIIASYTLQSLGELFISPIGYAMVGQLAPVALRGIMMGIWMMITGVSAIMSDHFSKMALTTDSVSPLITNAGYSHTFGMLGWSTIGVGIGLLVLTPFVARLTQEKRVTTLAEIELVEQSV